MCSTNSAQCLQNVSNEPNCPTKRSLFLQTTTRRLNPSQKYGKQRYRQANSGSTAVFPNGQISTKPYKCRSFKFTQQQKVFLQKPLSNIKALCAEGPFARRSFLPPGKTACFDYSNFRMVSIHSLRLSFSLLRSCWKWKVETSCGYFH